METITKTTAFIYIRVSTPSQQVDEQLKTIQQYADEYGIEIIGQYGDYRKRHKSLALQKLSWVSSSPEGHAAASAGDV